MKHKAQGLPFYISKQTGLFFVTTQRNLMSFLGSGMLMPSGAQFRYKEDSREKYYGAIPFWKGGLPSSDYYRDMLKDENTVIVECHIDKVVKYGRSYIVTENKRLLVVNSPVPLLSVTAFYMLSQQIIDDFVMRVPDDVILNSSIFKTNPNIDYFDVESDIKLTEIESIESQLTFIDSIGGGIKALLQFISDDIDDYVYIRDLINICIEAYSLHNLDTGKFISDWKYSKLSDVDKNIFLTLLPIIRDIKTEDGFNQVLLLEQLALGIEGKETSACDEIDEWIKYAKKAIEAEIEVPILADERDIFKRGALFFLLRPNLNRLKNSTTSPRPPGAAVLSIAAFLAGFANGLTRMGSEYKGDYSDFNRFTKSLLDMFWCKSKLSFSVDRKPHARYGAYEAYKINKEVLFKLYIKQNVVLARVLNQARSAGYELHYDYENQELYYEFPIDNDRYQTVYIELIPPLTPGFDAIRFVSPCQDVSSRNLKALKKNVAIDLLKQNCEHTMCCAFAYSDKRKAVVAVATQIVKTMDDDEFVTLLETVAKVADQYKKNA